MTAAVNDDQLKHQRWKFKQADWPSFKALCSTHLNKHTFKSDDPITDFSSTLLEIAEKTIPKSSVSSKQENPGLIMIANRAISERKKAERSFRKSPCHSKYLPLEFIEQRRVAPSNIKRKLHGDNLYPSINNRTPMNKIWNMINRIKGRANSSTVKHLSVKRG